MSRISYRPSSPFSPAVFKRWIPSAGIWGIGAGTAALYLLSVTPLVKRELLVNIPVLGSYYEDKTPPSDKPF